MSGPKVDKASLERAKRMELERRRNERLRALKAYNKAMDDCQASIANTSVACQEMLERYSGIPDIALPIGTVAANRQACLNRLSALTSQRMAAVADDGDTYTQVIDTQTQRVRSQTQQALADFEQGMAAPMALIHAYEQRVRNMETVSAVHFDRSSLPASLSPESLALYDRCETILTETAKGTMQPDEQQVAERFTKLFPLVLRLYNTPYLPGARREQIAGMAAAMKKHFENRAYQALDGVLSDFAPLLDIVEKQAAELEELYAQYRTVCECIRPYGVAAPCAPCDAFMNAQELRSAVNAAENRLRDLDEKAYIRRQIEDVMRLHHYTQMEPVVLRDERESGISGDHYLAGRTDRDHYLHVRISEEGHVMMEVVAVDDGEATVNNAQCVSGTLAGGASLSRDAVEANLRAQSGFCRIHASMLGELRARGVIFDAVVHNLPDARFARKMTLSNMHRKERPVTDQKPSIQRPVERTL